MSECGTDGVCAIDDNLCIFEGMEGFEGINPSDDSSLIALLDDLQEETLLHLFDDDLFAKDLSEFSLDNHSQNESQYSHNIPCPEDSFDAPQLTCCEVNPSDFLVSKDLLHGTNKHSRFELNDTADHCTSKKARLDCLAEADSTSAHKHTLAYVTHDHCYATVKGRHLSPISNSNSDEEASNEEGSNSDTGYDTMSTSTSPGNASLKPKETGKTVSSHLPITSIVDPVALIDARIKHYMCTREVNLTEEEKETLKAEGLPIPTTLPFTKVEERALKNVRRKIRNKVAAQESRKRKKEFVQTLEERVSTCDHENVQLKNRVKTLENENKCLMEELRKLRSILAKTSQTTTRAKVGTYIMVTILCFAVFYGGQTPSNIIWSNQKQSEYTTSSVRSRSLLSMDSRVGLHTKACDWFRQIFIKESMSGLSYSSDDLHLIDLHTRSVVLNNRTTSCHYNQTECQ